MPPQRGFYLAGTVAIILLLLLSCGCARQQPTGPSPVTPARTEPTAIPTQQTKIVRIEENDPAFNYTPGWKSEQHAGASGGSWTITQMGGFGYSNISGTVTFSGIGASLIYWSGPWGGYIELTLDGQNLSPIDSYAPTAQSKTAVIATKLNNTVHTLVIEPSETANPSVALPVGGPTKPAIVIDAIDVVTVIG